MPVKKICNTPYVVAFQCNRLQIVNIYGERRQFSPSSALNYLQGGGKLLSTTGQRELFQYQPSSILKLGKTRSCSNLHHSEEYKLRSRRQSACICSGKACGSQIIHEDETQQLREGMRCVWHGLLTCVRTAPSPCIPDSQYA